MKAKRLFHISCSRQRCVLRPVLAALVFILFACPLSAQFMAQRVNLAYLSQRADVIIRGQVTNVSQEPMPGYPNIPTIAVTIAVDQSMRGTTEKIYTFREVLIGWRSTPVKKMYEVGQHLFLFLPAPSQYGLSSPIGLGQGRFRVSQDSAGQTTVMNENSNAGLFRDVDMAAHKAGRPLTANQRRLAATERGPVALDEFVSLVKSLTTLPRIR